MTTVGDVALALAGAALVVVVVDSAVRTLVLPRGVSRMSLTGLVFRSSRAVFDVLARPNRSYEARDRVMALYAPTTLLALPAAWLVAVFAGFAAIFAALDHDGWRDAVATSGSSLLTLGFERPPGLGSTALSFVEATLGLGVVALLIAYLPTIYSSFSRREVAVTRLSVRAGTPPDPGQLLERAHRSGFLGDLDALWQEWELWFEELGESHTSLQVLAYFRSPNAHRSWVTAAGAVLDTAALRYAALDIPWTPAPALCIRSGFVALREVADHFAIAYDPDPRPDDPISIARQEVDDVCDRLAGAGLPVHADRDQVWRDYAGWRVNYDEVLLALSAELMAPYAPWVSDRSPRLPHGDRRRWPHGGWRPRRRSRRPR